MSNNVYLNLDEINALISGLHNLIEQEENQHCSADSANDLIYKLLELKEKVLAIAKATGEQK